MRTMRKIERKMDDKKALKLLISEEHGVLSTCGKDGQPYAIPINYIFYENDIYFHCANTGSKLDNIDENNKVCFTLVPYTELMPEKFSTKYESVIVVGTANKIYGEEKNLALLELIKKYSPNFMKEGKEYISRAVDKTTVIKIKIESITGKERF